MPRYSGQAQSRPRTCRARAELWGCARYLRSRRATMQGRATGRGRPRQPRAGHREAAAVKLSQEPGLRQEAHCRSLYYTAVLPRRQFITGPAAGKQLPVKLGIAVGHDIQVEFTTYQVDGAPTHGSCARGILQKIKNRGGERAWVARRNETAIPIFGHDIIA